MERSRIREITMGVVLGLGLVACGKAQSQPDTPRDSEGAVQHSVEVVEGRYYDCLRYTTADRGGLDCNLVSSDKRPTPSHNENIAISTEDIDGRKYDCFRYTTAYRGGLDCAPVS